MTILIVEDDANIAGQMKRMLETCTGIGLVSVARTLADGLALSKSLQPDITLLDLMLPDTAHWSDTVAAIPQFKPPVIVVTEIDDYEAEIAAFAAGAENVLRKSTAIKIASTLISAIAVASMKRIARDRNGEL